MENTHPTLYSNKPLSEAARSGAKFSGELVRHRASSSTGKGRIVFALAHKRYVPLLQTAELKECF